MPRDGNGTYTLPAGNPVVSGTIISSNWANTTMPDLAQGITDSLDRNGRGGMLAPFLFTDGTQSFPGAAYSLEPSTGWRRAGVGDMRVVVLGQDALRMFDGTLSVWDGVSAFTPVALQGGAGTVPGGTVDGDRLSWDQTTNQEWTVIPAALGGDLPAGSADGEIIVWDNTGEFWIVAPASRTVATGTGEGNTLRWDNTGFAWVENANFTVAADGALTALTYNGRDVAADGTVLDAHVADTTIHIPGTGFTAQVTLDQAAYDLLAPPDANTIYFVTP